MKSSGRAGIRRQLSRIKPLIGIIGGSGFYSFPEVKEIGRIAVKTRYGFPSDEISFLEWNGQPFAFLPRHGKSHAIPPHRVPYLSNLAALKSVGVQYVFSTCVVGSLKRELPPSTFVTPDQFVNFTWGRDRLPKSRGLTHLPMANPYCEALRSKLYNTARKLALSASPGGTIVVIQGPRFSTIAESRWFASQGWDIVNMTQYPECYFARELGLCYASVATVTDYDVGVHDEMVIQNLVNQEQIKQIFIDNVVKVKRLLTAAIETSRDLSCRCAAEVSAAYFIPSS